MSPGKGAEESRRVRWLKGAALAVLCSLLALSTYHLWRPMEVLTPARGPSGPRLWSRLELRLDAGWTARTDSGAAPAAVTLPDLEKMDLPRARVIYSNHFRLPPSLGGAARARLRVEGAYCRTRVLVNGKRLGEWGMPGLPLEVDVTGALKRQGENRLELVVDDRDALGLFGFFRPEPPSHPGPLPSANAFSSWKRAHLHGPVTLVLTGDPSMGSARISPSWRKKRVRVKVALHNGSAAAHKVRLDAALFLGERQVAAHASSHLLARGASSVSLEIPVESPALWGMPPHGEARRHTLVLTLSGPTGVSDQAAHGFGFRETWATRDGLQLNGEALFLMGHETSPDLRGEVPPGRLLLAAENVGINAWHVHFGAVRRELFELCDELGVYLIPSLVCVGPMNLDQEPAPRRFLGRYIKRWLQAFHNHPSVVIWGQELVHRWLPPGQRPELDRPAVDVDLRGLYATQEALTRFKQRRRTGETGGAVPNVGESEEAETGLVFIHEIHLLASLRPLPALLQGFPGLVGCNVKPLANTPQERGALDSLIKRVPGFNRAALAREVLPAVRISARRDLCLLHLPRRVAPRHLGGSLLGRGSPARLTAREEGELKIWILDGPTQQARTVQVRKAPLVSRRPVVELKL